LKAAVIALIVSYSVCLFICCTFLVWCNFSK